MGRSIGTRPIEQSDEQRFGTDMVLAADRVVKGHPNCRVVALKRHRG
jgi:hypothetical protein